MYVGGGLATRIVEKPRRTAGALLGLGTFIFSPQFFEHLHTAVTSDGGHGSDPVRVLDRLCALGARVGAVELRGLYVNINDHDALNLARIAVRSHDFHACTLGLALLMKGSVQDIARSIAEFRALDRFRQIVLVLPPGGPNPDTADGGECVYAPSSKYGDMMRTGLDALTTDIVLCAQSDGSCRPSDVPKFLEYLKDADVVVGTRTTRQLVEQGSNMRGIVRIAHIVLAKLMELVWWEYEPRFTGPSILGRRDCLTMVDGVFSASVQYGYWPGRDSRSSSPRRARDVNFRECGHHAEDVEGFFSTSEVRF